MTKRSTGADAGRAARLAALRRRSDPELVDRLFIGTLRIRIPKTIWTGPFSAEHPSLRIEALNQTTLTTGLSVSDYRIPGGAPGGWTREILTYPDVAKVDGLDEVGDGSLYRITYRSPPIIALYRRLQLPMQFPLEIQGGYLRWEVVARCAAFNEIMKHVRAVDPAVTIVSIRRRPLRRHKPVLTGAQQALLTQAMAAGYFAVPRGITLTALARKLDRSKSGISESIALIEKKLVETILEPGPVPT